MPHGVARGRAALPLPARARALPVRRGPYQPAPEETARRKQRALAGAEQARRDLARFYAEGRPDAKRERELRDLVDRTESGANERWQERERGARMAEGVAREQLHAFVREHIAELAALLIPRAVDLQARFDRARAEFARAVADRQLLLDEWRGLIGPVGIPPSDLPDDASGEVAVPRSLWPLLKGGASERDGEAAA